MLGYNNYRDDRTSFNNLTHSDGVLIERGCAVRKRIPPPNLIDPFGFRRRCIEYLQTLNESHVTDARLSGRRIIFRLGKKSHSNLRLRNFPLAGP